MAATLSARPSDLVITRRLVMVGYFTPFIMAFAQFGLKARPGLLTIGYFISNFALCALSFCVIYACLLRAHRYSVRKRHSLLRTALTTFVVCSLTLAGCTLVRIAVRAAFPDFLPQDPDDSSVPLEFVAATVSNSLLFMMIWGGIFLFPMTFQRAEKQREQIAMARREAEVLRLRAYFEPHFMLNTLNAIAGLVVDEPVEARRIIGLLGDLFRDASGERGDAHSLAEEIAWLQRYAAIHEARHKSIVRFVWDVDPDAALVPVPRLVLQPLVENAVLHGVLRRRKGGVVTVRARVDGAELVCDVEDDGPGFRDGARRAGARGLRIVERTLELFSAGASLTIASEGGATRVTSRLPITEAEPCANG